MFYFFANLKAFRFFKSTGMSSQRTDAEKATACFPVLVRSVFIERPSSLIARAMTWSNYKHHNTVKFLFGITPQEVISFISKAWGEG